MKPAEQEKEKINFKKQKPISGDDLVRLNRGVYAEEHSEGVEQFVVSRPYYYGVASTRLFLLHQSIQPTATVLHKPTDADLKRLTLTTNWQCIEY